MNPLSKPESVVEYHVPSVEGACRVIKHVCEKGEAASLAELTQVSEASRTTTLRIVSSLCNHGFLKRDAANTYRVGEALVWISGQISEPSDLRQRVVPVLHKLAKSVRETAHFAVPMESHCLLQEVADSPQIIRVASRPGTVTDYHCSATGKVILAFDDARRLRLRQTLPLAPRTANTITNWEDLDRELKRIRRRGYAVDDQEYNEGVRCIAVPVFGMDRSVAGAIGITGPVASVTKARVGPIAQTLISISKAFTQTTPQ